MSVVKEAICFSCKHYVFGERCAAFPQGIPADILRGEANHIEPRAGDHGIQFASRKRNAPKPVNEDRTRLEPHV